MKRILPRNRKKADYNLGTLWKDYKKENKESSKGITQARFNHIITRANTLSMEAVINNVSGFKMPGKLGDIFISKVKKDRSKKKTLNVNWKQSKEIGKKVYHLNNHSDNFDYKVFWNKRTAFCRNITMYSFGPCRKLSRNLAQAIFAKKDYFLLKR